MKERIFTRERTCFDFLRSIPSKRKFVVIGGFAVSAYEFPRLSVDLDIVIPEEELKFFMNLIKNQDFVFKKEKSDFDDIYGGKYEKYIKEEKLPVSVDLLINSVMARQTNYSYSFQYLFKHSKAREIRGWHPEAKVTVRVPKKEMLIALKVNSMRMADKRDIIMLCYEKPNADMIIRHLKDCPRDSIMDNLNELLELVGSQDHDNMIKGVFSLSDDVLKRAVIRCEKVMGEVLEMIE
ncbi:MAG: hypothetical protein JSW00_03515 [Thermoplasmata archaeon]|nr:MAG: hypothetical protein JSW00_03515 [Thermoplasmata archaeon]